MTISRYCVSLALLSVAVLQGTLPGAEPTTSDSGIVADFRFDDADGTRLADTANAAGEAKWDGGLTDCSVLDGRFRIRRNSTKAVNRYVDIEPDVRVGADTDGKSGNTRGWIVLEVSGWNLQGKTPNELIRFGFTSQPAKSLQTAAFVIARADSEKLALSGQAFGEGSGPVESEVTLPAEQSQPVTFIIELDKAANNQGKGDSGGVYRLYYRVGADGPFQRIGGDGQVRRLRNGNYLHLRVEGYFGARREFFDIDRLYFTTRNPISS